MTSLGIPHGGTGGLDGLFQDTPASMEPEGCPEPLAYPDLIVSHDSTILDNWESVLDYFDSLEYWKREMRALESQILVPELKLAQRKGRGDV